MISQLILAGGKLGATPHSNRTYLPRNDGRGTLAEGGSCGSCGTRGASGVSAEGGALDRPRKRGASGVNAVSPTGGASGVMAEGGIDRIVGRPVERDPPRRVRSWRRGGGGRWGGWMIGGGRTITGGRRS
ncbi:MAG: hypothetical protein MPW14_09135 [Candidatus Manganitrophus sp.]|nr:hypothetical protein [Candidatus Manganitrophus sp.]WDT70871.1 MAG: hypothetical protein MPW17_19325 [Candidatus Manganitrophus sp.]WDT81858.1 MAG: hypothetical protein MPW14_09135 [Candidatus Manganitrophus sp.]